MTLEMVLCDQLGKQRITLEQCRALLLELKHDNNLTDLTLYKIDAMILTLNSFVQVTE